MVSVQNGTLVPMLLADFRDPQTGKIRVRNVDINSESYRAARQYMLRLDYTDFEKASWTKKLAQAANLSVDELKARFS
jgi:6-phosphofructokinase 1